MCFVRLWNSGFLANAMLPWLSAQRVIGAFRSPSPPTVDIWSRNLRTHMPSLDAWVSAMYSASVDDKAIVDCCLLHQDIAVRGEFAFASDIVHTYGPVLLLVSWPPAQSASLNTAGVTFPFHVKGPK